MSECSICQLVFTTEYAIDEVIIHYELHIEELEIELANKRSHTYE